MRQLHFSLLVTLFFISCQHKREYTICKFEIEDEQLLIYNQILNELVEHHFYNGYLGSEYENLWSKYDVLRDTAELKQERIILQNKLYKSKAKFCTLILDTAGFYDKSSNKILLKDKYAGLEKGVKSLGAADIFVDSLTTIQNKYSGKDFKFCTSTVISISEKPSSNNSCKIGKVKLSRLFLNKQHTKGFLFYEIGGMRCAKAELVMFEKANGGWRIKNTFMFWIS